MTMIDTLFGLVPTASTGQQWVARDLQLVNWGGYDGHHRVRLASTATLLSGGSGSGKSTLMDAYIALLMPHTTPFNGASNGGVVGRPRGKGFTVTRQGPAMLARIPPRRQGGQIMLRRNMKHWINLARSGWTWGMICP